MICCDGSFELGGGRSFTPTLDGRPPGAVELLRGDRAVEWRAGHGRFRVEGRMVAAPGGTALWIEIVNPYIEAREIEFALDSGAKTSKMLAHVPGGSVRGGRITRKLLLPPMGRGGIEAVLLPRTLAGRALAFSAHAAAADEVWDRALGSFAHCSLPAAELDQAFRRAREVLLGCVSPGVEGELALWPRPGLPPAAGPLTLDALALAAMAEWGAADLFYSAIEWVLVAGDQMLAEPRAVWGSDAGALLWAAARGLLAEDAADYAKRIASDVGRRAGGLISDLNAGLIARMPGPRILGHEVRAWNEGWTWKGVAAAADILDRAGAGSASDVRSAAESLRDRLLGAYCERPKALYCLARLGVVGDAEPGRDGEEDLFRWAERLAGSRDGERELRTSVFFLRSLRSLLLKEEDGRIVLLDGVDADWFRGGRGLEFSCLPAGRGTVSASFLFRRGGAIVRVESTGEGAILLKLPLRRAAGAVAMVNGVRVAVKDGAIALPPGRAWDISV